MSRHFDSAAHILETVDQELLDRLRQRAHPESPIGILYEVASVLLESARVASDSVAALQGLLADVRGAQVIGWIPIVWSGEPGTGKQEAGGFMAAEQARAALAKAGRRS